MYDDAQTCWFTAPGGGPTSEFTLADDGATVPVDSGVTLEAAGSIVEQFLRTPRQRPAGEWVDAETLTWPEDY